MSLLLDFVAQKKKKFRLTRPILIKSYKRCVCPPPPKTQIATFHKIMNLSWCSSSRATHLAVPTPSAQPKIIKEILWVLQGHQSTMSHINSSPCSDCHVGWLCWTWRRTAAFMNSDYGMDCVEGKKLWPAYFGEKTSACVKSNTTFARNLQFSLNCPFWLNLPILWTCLDFSSFLERLL